MSRLAEAVGATKVRGPAPVENWHPAYCGAIDMRIAADGTWFYNGSPIKRPALVALFAGILRKDPERFVLVTPVECVGIAVDDAPFVAVAMAELGDTLRVVTNIGDEVDVGLAHPLRFSLDTDGGVKPYVRVRGDLWARFTRTLAVDLLDRIVSELHDGSEIIGIRSGGTFFPIGATEPPT